MKILVMTLQDSGGGCGKLTRAINEHPDHSAKGTRWRKGKIVSYDVSDKYCIWQPNKSTTIGLIKWCDAIITTGPWCGLPRKLPWGTNKLIPPNAPKRPMAVNYRGSPYRKNKDGYNKVDKKHRVIQSGNFIDLLLYGNFQHWLPVPVWAYELSRYRKPSNVFTVAQCVTQLKRAHLKSVPGIKKRLQDYAGIHYDLIHNVEHNECLTRLGKADLVITAFKNGYGTAGLESMAMGIPVIANGFQAYINKVIELCGKLPFYQSSVQDIQSAILTLKSNRDVYDQYVQIGFDYLDRFHHPLIVADKAVNLCKLALNKM